VRETIKIEPIEAPPPATFDCGVDEQNRFFHERCWKDQAELLSTTYLLQVHGLAAGLATVCMDALPLSRRERGPAIEYRHVSSLKLAQLGIDQRFQGLGLGTRALAFVIDVAREVGKRVGCRYVTLDSQPDLEEWYRDRGFVRNELHQQQRSADALLHQRDPDRIAVSMRYDLRKAA
jgi:GNAT superfamily N-acetyltransferase